MIYFNMVKQQFMRSGISDMKTRANKQTSFSKLQKTTVVKQQGVTSRLSQNQKRESKKTGDA